jgi:hypothetical protein
MRGWIAIFALVLGCGSSPVGEGFSPTAITPDANSGEDCALFAGTAEGIGFRIPKQRCTFTLAEAAAGIHIDCEPLVSA